MASLTGATIEGWMDFILAPFTALCMMCNHTLPKLRLYSRLKKAKRQFITSYISAGTLCWIRSSYEKHKKYQFQGNWDRLCCSLHNYVHPSGTRREFGTLNEIKQQQNRRQYWNKEGFRVPWSGWINIKWKIIVKCFDFISIRPICVKILIYLYCNQLLLKATSLERQSNLYEIICHMSSV